MGPRTARDCLIRIARCASPDSPVADPQLAMSDLLAVSCLTPTRHNQRSFPTSFRHPARETCTPSGTRVLRSCCLLQTGTPIRSDTAPSRAGMPAAMKSQCSIPRAALGGSRPLIAASWRSQGLPAGSRLLTSGAGTRAPDRCPAAPSAGAAACGADRAAAPLLRCCTWIQAA